MALPSRPYLGSAAPATGPGCLRSGGKTSARHHHRRSKMADMAAPASPPLPPPTCQSPRPGTAPLPSARLPIGRCAELRSLIGRRATVSQRAKRPPQGGTRMAAGSQPPVGQSAHGAGAPPFPPSRPSNKATSR